VSRLRSSFAESFDLVQNRVGRRGPDERLAVLVVMRQVIRDRLLERCDGLERAAADALRRDLREETFDLIQPARTGRCEMHVIARMPGEPAHDLRHLVGAVVIHDDVDVAGGWELRVELLQKLEQLLMPMPSMTLADDLAGGDIKRREQRGRPMPNVIVRLLRRNARSHRQQRPRPIQGLDLTLLIDAEDERVVRRIQIQADNRADFLDELRVCGQRERVDAMRLQAEGAPDPRDRGPRQAGDLRHRARTPLRPFRGWAFERSRNHVHDVIVGDDARRARTRLVGQAFQTAHAKPFAPFAHTVAGKPLASGDLAIRQPLRARQHDPRALGEALRRLRPTRPWLEDASLVIRQPQRFVVTHAHGAQRSRRDLFRQRTSETRH